MITIGIETTYKVGSIGLLKDGVGVFEQILPGEYLHSSNLVPAMRLILSETGCKISDIEAIGVNVGPGSFTGIRIGIAFAMGISSSLQKNIIGVDAFEAIMCNFKHREGCICVIIPANRGTFHVGTFMFSSSPLRGEDRGAGGQIHKFFSIGFMNLGDYNCYTGKNLIEYIGNISEGQKKVLCVGPGLEEIKTMLKHNKNILFHSGEFYPRGKDVAMIAHEKYLSKSFSCDVSPLYLRPSYTDTIKDARS